MVNTTPTIIRRLSMKPIPNHPGYFATENGQIVSVRSGENRTIQQRINKGYKVVTISVIRSGKRERHRFDVHRLVASAFHGMPTAASTQCRHLNGNRIDNRPQNLAWGTVAENVHDSIRHGTLGPGMKAHHRRLSIEQVEEIRRRIKAGETDASLAREFSVSAGYPTKIATGQRWEGV